MNYRLRAALAAVETRYPIGPPTDEDRERIATEAGLPASLAPRLKGDTIEELTESADELSAEIEAIYDERPQADTDEITTELARQNRERRTTGGSGDNAHYLSNSIERQMAEDAGELPWWR